MALPPRDHRISLGEASMLTRRHRAAGVGEHGGAFHADQVIAMLNQPGCVALRIYYGMSEEGKPALLLVGVDQNDTDMTGTVLEYHVPCPPFCGLASQLNS